jgi:F-type H+-transporting ATPase subunit b
MMPLAFAENIQLFPDGTLFIHIALILVMIWVLNRTLFEPVNRILKSREARAGNEDGDAREILEKAVEKEEKLKQELLAARNEGYELVQKEREQAAEQRSQIIAEAKKKAALDSEREKQAILTERDSLKQAVSAESDRIAERIVTLVLEK